MFKNILLRLISYKVHKKMAIYKNTKKVKLFTLHYTKYNVTLFFKDNVIQGGAISQQAFLKSGGETAKHFTAEHLICYRPNKLSDGFF
jgi:hypothetical protein